MGDSTARALTPNSASVSTNASSRITTKIRHACNASLVAAAESCLDGKIALSGCQWAIFVLSCRCDI
ncbi:hypothetical protein SNOG_08776 [Parastagonospora nodorum SN15]|uniref:Uncharacterized protein n=1 Tax=Phaeosphaeria nodorum (strain SN15 / ATCC MYA-4574 / FGSC 10173) TaxID=321614 RepID=Q0UHI8_PHANO|nr:hypothetical protein SNOG_08776 [Parastagonospora nodorum SN15]EAT83944.1 hypothetical protein SNOG_08776 [Parastagonospora nodorum SN15]